MSDNIKTGAEIYIEVDEKTKDKQWVSLDWLKEQIGNKQYPNAESLEPVEDDTFEYGEFETLNWVLKLLEKG